MKADTRHRAIATITVSLSAQGRFAAMIQARNAIDAQLQAFADGLIIGAGGDPAQKWNYDPGAGTLSIIALPVSSVVEPPDRVSGVQGDSR